jgi:hypothetical protein
MKMEGWGFMAIVSRCQLGLACVAVLSLRTRVRGSGMYVPPGGTRLTWVVVGNSLLGHFIPFALLGQESINAITYSYIESLL